MRNDATTVISLKWDEAKLEETEAGKNATMKITEPKTPFAYSVADVSEEEGSTHSTYAAGIALLAY